MNRPESLPLGTRLRRLRTEAALTQEALAERAGVSVRAVSDLERGLRQVPRFETLGLLADALQLEPAARAAFMATARSAGTATSPGLPEPSSSAAIPRPLTSLVGREQACAALSQLVQTGEHRLLTLTGPGGVGKTRLAIAVAESVTSRFADSVAFVELTAVRDPALVPAAVAAAVGIRAVGASSLFDQLAAYLHSRAMLLLLDNFEQVLTAAPFVNGLLRTSPELRVLVTSRVPLHVSAEQVVPVGPLTVPEAGAAIVIEELPQPEAIALFLARARAADPGFALTTENGAAVSALVRRLDGLPLAIELAAARVRTLPPSALLDQLARQPLQLLTEGPHDQPTRQRTIRDAIGWSYHLLPPGDQRLFRRLSVFVGGFTLAAAEAVAEPSRTEEWGILDSISRLMDASMIRRISGDGEQPRFIMLEMIREFGLEQLAAHGEDIAIHDAHAAWVVRLVDQAEPELLGRNQRQWLNDLDAELPNLRAALGWLQHTGAAETLLCVLSQSLWFWYIRGHLTEGRSWLERSLAGNPAISPVVHARALFAASSLAFGQADYAASLADAQASLTTAERADDPRGVAFARFLLGMSPQMEGDYALGAARLEQALALWRQIDDPVWIGMTLTQLAEAYFGLGDLDRATALHEEALQILRMIGMPWALTVVLGCYGNVVLEQGDTARAHSLMLESLSVGQGIDDQRLAGETLLTLAIVAERFGCYQHAAQLIGIVEAIRERIRTPLALIPAQAARYEHTVAIAQAHLGDEGFAAAYTKGRSLSLPEVIRVVETMMVPQPDDPGSALEIS